MSPDKGDLAIDKPQKDSPYPLNFLCNYPYDTKPKNDKFFPEITGISVQQKITDNSIVV